MKNIMFVTLLVVIIPSVIFAQDILLKKVSASPDDFVGKEIVLECLFAKLSTHFLDDRRGDPSAYFPSTKYQGFSIGTQIEPGVFIHTLFMEQSKGEILYKLKRNDKITIRGKVKSSLSRMPWIEVYEVKMGWK